MQRRKNAMPKPDIHAAFRIGAVFAMALFLWGSIPACAQGPCASTSIFNVTGGGYYCAGCNGVPVGLDGSQSGVNYQLQLANVNTGSSVAGTGSAISFGNQTALGTYTVVAIVANTGCTTNMNGSATVTVAPQQDRPSPAALMARLRWETIFSPSVGWPPIARCCP